MRGGAAFGIFGLEFADQGQVDSESLDLENVVLHFLIGAAFGDLFHSIPIALILFMEQVIQNVGELVSSVPVSMHILG